MRWRGWAGGVVLGLLLWMVWPVGVHATPVREDPPPDLPEAIDVSEAIPERPSAAAGEPVYMQGCAPCHGKAGEGNGPASQGLSTAPTAFSETASLRALSPRQVFDVIRRGRIERGMPAWANRLSTAATWSLVAYLFDLTLSVETYRAGQAIYREHCAPCHDERGTGDGPAAASLDVPDLTRWSDWVDVSNAAWVHRLLQDPVHLPVTGELSRVELDQAVAYVRTLSYSSTRAPLSGSGEIAGKVIMMTADEKADFAGLEVTLFGFRGSMAPQLVLTTTVTPSHTFRFEGLSTEPDVVYSVSTSWEGVLYTSGAVMFAPGEPRITVTLPVAATTEVDPGLRADQVYWFVDVQGDQVVVGELVSLTNPGDRTYVGLPVATHEGKRAAVRWALPAAARQVTVEGGRLGERFLLVDDTLVDTVPVTPGADTRRLLFRYTLPLVQGRAELRHPLSLPVRFLSLFIAERGQAVEVPDFMVKGQVQRVGNVTFQAYMASYLEAGTVITVTLREVPARSGDVAALQPVSGRTTRVVGLVLVGVFGVGLLGSVIYATRHRATIRVQSAWRARRDVLLRDIAALDAQFAAGGIDEATYRAARDVRMAEAVHLTRLLEQHTATGAQGPETVAHAGSCEDTPSSGDTIHGGHDA